MRVIRNSVLALISVLIFSFNSITICGSLESLPVEHIVCEIIDHGEIVETGDIYPQENIVFPLSDKEVELIAWITNAEAEGESELGKRLVIDTILNRIDSSKFPNTVSEVIYQPSQFSCLDCSRAARVSYTDELCQLVREEVNERKDSEVVYFCAGGYSIYGTPLFVEDHHYFSGH